MNNEWLASRVERWHQQNNTSTINSREKKRVRNGESGRLLWGIFFKWLQAELFMLSISYCPAKRENRAGSSRNEIDYSRRSNQAIFPLLDCRSCENFGLAHFSIFSLEKKSRSNKSPHFDQMSVSRQHIRGLFGSCLAFSSREDFIESAISSLVDSRRLTVRPPVLTANFHRPSKRHTGYNIIINKSHMPDQLLWENLRLQSSPLPPLSPSSRL